MDIATALLAAKLTGVPKPAAGDNGKALLANANGGYTLTDLGPGISYEVVSELPSTGEAGVIYLVANGGTGTNVYDEYIWTGSGYEKIGTTEPPNEIVYVTVSGTAPNYTSDAYLDDISQMVTQGKTVFLRINTEILPLVRVSSNVALFSSPLTKLQSCYVGIKSRLSTFPVVVEYYSYLPTVSSSDNGKMLGVVNGAWAATNVPAELPAVTSSDNGKVLGVVNGAWAATSGGGGSADIFWINVTKTSSGGVDTYTADKTFAEVQTAVQAGMLPAVIYAKNIFRFYYNYNNYFYLFHLSSKDVDKGITISSNGVEYNEQIQIPRGGTTGQVLSKNSDSDFDYTWRDPGIDSAYVTLDLKDYTDLPGAISTILSAAASKARTIGDATAFSYTVGGSDEDFSDFIDDVLAYDSGGTGDQVVRVVPNLTGVAALPCIASSYKDSDGLTLVTFTLSTVFSTSNVGFQCSLSFVVSSKNVFAVGTVTPSTV